MVDAAYDQVHGPFEVEMGSCRRQASRWNRIRGWRFKLSSVSYSHSEPEILSRLRVRMYECSTVLP